MPDLAAIAASIFLFLLGIAYAYGCERLKDGRS